MKTATVQDLLTLFLKTNDLTKLVNKASQVIRNPLLMCDTSYHFLAYSSVAKVKDRSWQIGIKRGNWSYELVSTISKLDLDYSGRTHKTQMLTNVSDLTTLRRKIGTLCIDGLHLGYYLVLEEDTPFEEIDEKTYCQVEGILAKCLSMLRPLMVSNKSDFCESVILDLLQNRLTSEPIFLERAAKCGLPHKGLYRVYCIDTRKYQNNANNVVDGINKSINSLRSVIGQSLPLSWQVSYQDYIVVLADFSAKIYQREETLDSFRCFLMENGLHAGQSDSFENLFLLADYYEQAQNAVSIGTWFAEERQIIPYEDYKIYALFCHVPDKNLFTHYSTEVIRKICAYDAENGTQYFETVYHYLANRCSVFEAARALFVHRNTVIYRISRVGELFGLTFEDNWNNYLNYTSCLLRKYYEIKPCDED